MGLWVLCCKGICHTVFMHVSDEAEICLYALGNGTEKEREAKVKRLLPSWGRCVNERQSRGHSRSGRCSFPTPAPAREAERPRAGESSRALEERWCPHLDICISDREDTKETFSWSILNCTVRVNSLFQPEYF